MAKTHTTSSDHLTSGTVASTVMPITLAIWVNPSSLSTFLHFFSFGASTAASSYFSLSLDATGGTSRLAAVTSKSGQVSQARTLITPSTSAWQHFLGVFNSTSDIRSFYGGVNKATGTGVTPDVTVDTTIVCGRNPDFASNFVGQSAHAAVWTRALADLEVAYLGVGGSPRAIKGVASYWKIGSSESPVIDQVSGNSLTVSGTTSGTSDPNLQTFMTGGPVGALSYTQGVAITAINLAAGHVFDDVSSAFGSTLQQLASPTQPTTTNTSGTTARVVGITSASAYTAGDYMKITSGGTPTRVLAVDATNNLLLVADDQTWSSSANVYRYAVNPLTVAGLSVSSNSFSGTPTAAATYSNCLFRATCTGATTLLADTDVFTMTIASGGGGGGGGGLQSPAGAFSGGFSGG